MTPESYVAAVRREGDALAAAGEASLDRPVESCPGWSVGDLLYHVGEVHRFWSDIVVELRTDVDDLAMPPRPSDDLLVDWYRQGLDRVCTVLASADPTSVCWTWAAQKDVAFVQRRMAQETAVHRWDGQNAAGAAEPIEHDLAVDGIDEFADVMYGARPSSADETRAGTVHLHCTDGAGEWLFEPAARDHRVTRGHIKGDAALRGSASDLLLALWRRVPLERLDVVGDAEVARQFLGGSVLD
jgi:uncharacterized protein (TIGR03083 family)